MTDLPSEIQVWESYPKLHHTGTWATTRYPAKAVPYVCKADAELAVAEAIRRAAEAGADIAERTRPDGFSEAASNAYHSGAMDVVDAILALAPSESLAEVQRLRDERDRFEAALGRACLVGGTTYLVQIAEAAEAERADEWRRRRDADASRDAAKAACETMRAERDAALARVEKLRHQITEASDPDFMFGAMDNVNDMDVTLDQFAAATSRAIRAAMEDAE